VKFVSSIYVTDIIIWFVLIFVVNQKIREVIVYIVSEEAEFFSSQINPSVSLYLRIL